MNKTILYSAAVIIMVLLGACEREALLPDNETNPTAGRTLSLTASIPGEDNPTTKVAIEQQADKSIALTWEAGDVLQLVFVQGETKIKGTAAVTNITNENKSGKFDIVVPDGIDQSKNFNLYGVYGPENSLSGTNFTDVILPTNPSQATSLNGTETTSIQKRKDVMLYFESKDINITTSPQVSVIFKHLGSLFSITLKNTGEASLDNLQEALLVGVNNSGNINWAYNATGDAQSYDLVEDKFRNIESAGNQISFKAPTNSLPAGGETTFWAWYPPLTNKEWPALQLQLKSTNTDLATSANTLPERTAPTVAGKAFYFYATWDGQDLNFTNESFTNDLTLNVATKGALGSLLSSTQKANTTKLTLTGQINEADFTVMKKQMPNLTYLDLSQVICEDNKIPSKAIGDQSSSSVNKTITTIILPESITTIELYAFYKCSGLKGSLTIPNEVTSIGKYAFSGCSSMNGSLTLPASLVTIEEGAFQDCSGFTGALNIPNNVTTIGSTAFESCSGFNGSLTLPTNLTTIGDHAFKNCLGFTGALTIPNKVTSIGMYAFFGSKGFNSTLTLPTSLTSIGIYAFYGCTNVTKFQFLSATPVDYLEEMLPNGKPVTVPTEAAVTAYQTKWGTSRHAITAAE